jgi:hypothetical protein
MEYIVLADSQHRDVTLYPYGNTYTLHLSSPIKNVTQVDLVSALVPNTMYNLTSTSNVLRISGTSNIWFNPGFYSSADFVSSFNTSNQVSSSVATVVYLVGEGKLMFYGSLTSVECLNSEIASLIGLPLGVTNTLNISSNQGYATHTTYGLASRYVKSQNVYNSNLSKNIWLDIREFRTPTTIDALKLITASNLRTTQSNTSATSFGIIPLDVNGGELKSFREGSDYKISVNFPSRIDSLERLSVQWLDRDGIPLIFNGLDTNSFTLRVHTVVIPDVPERPESLPRPVEDKERNIIMYSSIVSLVIGLLLILFSRRRH